MFLIHAGIAHVFNPTAELAIIVRIPTNEPREKIETN